LGWFEPLGCSVFYGKSYGSCRCQGPRNGALPGVEGDHAIVTRYVARRGNVATRESPVFDGKIVVRGRESKGEPDEEEGDDKGKHDSHFRKTSLNCERVLLIGIYSAKRMSRSWIVRKGRRITNQEGG
jgi:hypothetical protein